MKLSIIVPAYRSESKIEETVRRLRELAIPNVEKEIIVVDDCSPDNTYEILKKLAGIKLIKHEKNTGKGGAVRTGLENSTGEILLIQDDDLEYDPFEIPLLIKPIIENKTKIVFGSRHLNKNNKYSSLAYYLGGIFLD